MRKVFSRFGILCCALFGMEGHSAELPPSLTDNCLGCHAGPSAAAGLDFSDEETIRATRCEMISEILTNGMPLPNPNNWANDTDRADLVMWLQALEVIPCP